MQKKLGPKNVSIVGISFEPLGTVKPFVEKMGTNMEYTIAVDKNGRTTDAYSSAVGDGGIPHAYVIDKSGVIVWHGLPSEGLEKVVNQVVAGTFDRTKASSSLKKSQQGK